MRTIKDHQVRNDSNEIEEALTLQKSTDAVDKMITASTKIAKISEAATHIEMKNSPVALLFKKHMKPEM